MRTQELHAQQVGHVERRNANRGDAIARQIDRVQVDQLPELRGNDTDGSEHFWTAPLMLGCTT